MRDLQDESNVGIGMYRDHIYLLSSKYASLNTVGGTLSAGFDKFWC
jgi:hypothetical protein